MVRGTFEPDKTDLNLVEMFNQLFLLHEPIASGRSIHLEIVVDDKSSVDLSEAVVVQGDQFHLRWPSGLCSTIRALS